MCRARHLIMKTNRPERGATRDPGPLTIVGRKTRVVGTPKPNDARRKTLIAVAKNKEKQKKSKKDAQLVLRLEKDLRDRFIDACQDLDTSAAREVRRFIKRFLRRYDKGELDD